MPDFRNPAPPIPANEIWYDIKYDRELIEQSIAKQYHILPSQQGELAYDDWAKLVSGLMEDTPLGQIISTRREDNKDVLKHFSKHQHSVRNEWRTWQNDRMAETVNRAGWEKSIANLEKMLSAMFGGG